MGLLICGPCHVALALALVWTKTAYAWTCICYLGIAQLIEKVLVKGTIAL